MGNWPQAGVSQCRATLAWMAPSQSHQVAFFWMMGRRYSLTEPPRLPVHCKKPSPRREIYCRKKYCSAGQRAEVYAARMGSLLPAATHTNLSGIIKA